MVEPCTPTGSTSDKTDFSDLEILQRCLVYHHPSSVPLHQNIILSCLTSLLQVEFVLEARAASTLHRHPQPALECDTILRFWFCLSSHLIA